MPYLSGGPRTFPNKQGLTESVKEDATYFSSEANRSVPEGVLLSNSCGVFEAHLLCCSFGEALVCRDEVGTAEMDLAFHAQSTRLC